MNIKENINCKDCSCLDTCYRCTEIIDSIRKTSSDIFYGVLIKPDINIEVGCSRFKKRESIMEEKRDEKTEVTRPDYYCVGREYEPRKVIRDWGLNFNLGNVIKYVSRAGRKDPSKKLEDLRKAEQYLKFEIEELENKYWSAEGEKLVNGY